ncbi:MAG: phospholipid carrier-dependent glycosyltransferase [Deltaproteobacteria bacterium]|nr:phospholipid carrier-dependent glycosyltransferase [Deltaproteobacteria bacterium]
MMREGSKKIKIFLGVFLAVYFFVLCNQIANVPSLYWDELIHVSSAMSFLHQPYPNYNFMTQTVLGKQLIAVSLFVFGETPSGARFLSAFASLSCLIFLGLCCYKLYQSLILCCFSILLLAFDPLFFLHSKLATLDMYSALVIGISFYKFLVIFKKETNKIKSSDFLVLGFLLGLAISIKVHALVLVIPYIFLSSKKISFGSVLAYFKLFF